MIVVPLGGDAAPVPAAVDPGRVQVTTGRVIFEGAGQAPGCASAGLIGLRHAGTGGCAAFPVPDRRTPAAIRYGPELAGCFGSGLDLAFAHARGNAGDLARQLQAEFAQTGADLYAAPFT